MGSIRDRLKEIADSGSTTPISAQKAYKPAGTMNPGRLYSGKKEEEDGLDTASARARQLVQARQAAMERANARAQEIREKRMVRDLGTGSAREERLKTSQQAAASRLHAENRRANAGFTTFARGNAVTQTSEMDTGRALAEGLNRSGMDMQTRGEAAAESQRRASELQKQLTNQEKVLQNVYDAYMKAPSEELYNGYQNLYKRYENTKQAYALYAEKYQKDAQEYREAEKFYALMQQEAEKQQRKQDAEMGVETGEDGKRRIVDFEKYNAAAGINPETLYTGADARAADEALEPYAKQLEYWQRNGTKDRKTQQAVQNSMNALKDAYIDNPQATTAQRDKARKLLAQMDALENIGNADALTYTAAQLPLGMEGQIRGVTSLAGTAIGDLATGGKTSDDFKALTDFLAANPAYEKLVFESGTAADFVARKAGVSPASVKAYREANVNAYNTQKVSDYYEGVSDTYKETAGRMAYSVGQQLPSMLLTMGGGEMIGSISQRAASGAITEAAAKTQMAAVEALSKSISVGLMSVGAAGNTLTERANESGYSLANYAYAAATGATEAATEYMLGTTGDVASYQLKVRGVQELFQNALEEGIEEMLGYPIESAADWLFASSKSVDEWVDKITKNSVLDKMSVKEWLQSGIEGFAVGGLMGVSGLVLNSDSGDYDSTGFDRRIKGYAGRESVDYFADMADMEQLNARYEQLRAVYGTQGTDPDTRKMARINNQYISRVGYTAMRAYMEKNGIDMTPAREKLVPVAQKKSASGMETQNKKYISMEDFVNRESNAFTNLAYDDTQAQKEITDRTHQEMISDGQVVTVPESTDAVVEKYYPDLRDMKKTERTPIIKQKMKELKAALRQFLNTIKGNSYEFEVNGQILDAKLYNTGIREVLEKVTQNKAAMLYHSDEIFKNARYLYSTPDYEGDPNVYRWNYFYTPVQMGDATVGVRIAVRDVENPAGSQIYNWNIKNNAALGGEGRLQESSSSSGTSSAALNESADGGVQTENSTSEPAPENGDASVGTSLDGGSRDQKVASSGVSSDAQTGENKAPVSDIMVPQGESGVKENYARAAEENTEVRAENAQTTVQEAPVDLIPDTQAARMTEARDANMKRAARLRQRVADAEAEIASPYELGVKNGETEAQNRVVPESIARRDAAMQEARQILQDAGYPDTGFVTGPIERYGGTDHFALTKSGKVLIQADSVWNTPQDIARAFVQENGKGEVNHEIERKEQVSFSDRDAGRRGTEPGRERAERVPAAERLRGGTREHREAADQRRRAAAEQPEVSPEEAGVPLGSEARSCRIQPESTWDAEQNVAAEYAYSKGAKTVVYLTGDVQVEYEGATEVIEGAWDAETGTLYVRADSLSRSVSETVEHEVVHAMITLGNVERFMTLVKQKKTAAWSALYAAYEKRYRSFTEGMTAKEKGLYIWEEILADAYSETNRYGVRAGAFAAQADEAMEGAGRVRRGEERSARHYSADVETERGRGPPDGRFSIGETDDGSAVAVVDSDILSGIDTSNWNSTKKAQAKKAAKTALLAFKDGVRVNGITYKVNKVSRDEFTRSNDTERLYRKEPEIFADKLRASANAYDIITATTSWANDGELIHPRTDNLVDFVHGDVLIRAGKNQYKAKAVVGVTSGGEYVFYDVVDMEPANFKMKEEPSTAAFGTETVSAIQESPSYERVAENAASVKGKFSASDTTADPVPEYLHEMAAARAEQKRKERAEKTSRPTISEKQLRSELLDLFSIPEGMRGEMGRWIDHYAQRLLRDGRLTEQERDEFVDRLYAEGVMTAAADEAYKEVLRAVRGRKIYVNDSVINELGDDWTDLRRRAFGVGLTLTKNPGDMSIDVWNGEMAQLLPGNFRDGDADESAILRRIIQTAEEGKDLKMSLPEYTQYIGQYEGITEDQVLDDLERKVDGALQRFADKAGLETYMKKWTAEKLTKERAEFGERQKNLLDRKNAQTKKELEKQREKFGESQKKLLDRKNEQIRQERDWYRQGQQELREKTKKTLEKERAARKATAEKRRAHQELREMQQKTLKQLQWLSRNRNKAPEELRARWNEVLGDIDVYAVGAANEMNFSQKWGATWKDLAQMYQQAKENDPNFLPSAELERIVSRLNDKKIADMDIDALQNLYKAAVGIRTEFNNRNTVINDQLDRQFEEVYADSKTEIENAPGKYTGKALDKLFNEQQLTPMNILERMAGWNPDSTFYSMAKQINRGTEQARDYTVRAKRMLEDFLNKNKKWVNRSDGQGKKGIWYKIEVPPLMELNMGDQPVFGEPVTVWMTPAQKVQMYLESKNTDNLTHMAGGRTFVDKELYSQGKRTEAFAQGKTIRLAPETVKKITADLTAEEKALADILEKYYNGFAKEKINRVSNALYGFDKAMGKNYAPIYTNRNFTKSEIGQFDVTAEGAGNLKARIKGSKNPSYNIGAYDAFERHVDKTANFVGMAIPARNWQTLLNWREKNSSMADVISHKWGDAGLNYIKDILVELQGKERVKTDVISSTFDKALSNYISSVFGFNVSIVAKQLGSIPMASAYLGISNMPTPKQIRKIDTKLVDKYTSELAWRTMGYSMPETAQLKDAPNWSQKNKTVEFMFGGGAITWMDGWAARTLWPWAENKVRREHPELKIGTQAEIDAGESPFYQKVAEEFNEAVQRSQSTAEDIYQSTLRKSKNPVARIFTMFKSDSAQSYNAIRQTFGELNYLKNSGADAKTVKAAQRKAGSAVLSVIVNSVWAQTVTFLNALLKNAAKYYRDDDDELTAKSIAGEVVSGVVGDLAGVMAGGEELADAIGAILTGDNWWGLDTPGVEQIAEMADAIVNAGKGTIENMKTALSMIREKGSLGDYFRRHAGEILSDVHEIAELTATYLPGLPVKNVEGYLLGVLRMVSPKIYAAYEDMMDPPERKDLAGLEGPELKRRVGDIMKRITGESDKEASAVLAELYSAGYANVIPGSTPKSITVNGETRELSETQAQRYEKAWRTAEGGWANKLTQMGFFEDADDAEKEKMLSWLYDYAGQKARKAVFSDYETTSRTEKFDALLGAGLDMADVLLTYAKYTQIKDEKDAKATQQATDFAVWAQQNFSPKQAETIREQLAFYSMIKGEAGRYDKLTDAGLGIEAAERMTKALAALEPEEGKENVSVRQQYRAVLDSDLSDGDKAAAIGTLMDSTDEYTEKGELSQWGKFKKVLDSGLTLEDWYDMYTEEQLDNFCRYMDEGISGEAAMQTAEALDELKDQYEGTDENPKDIEKWRAIALQPYDEFTKSIVLEKMMDEDAYAKYRGARDAGMSTWQYVDFKDQVSYLEADKDANGKTIRNSLKNKVVKLIDSMDISGEAKDYLYLNVQKYAKSGLGSTPWH
nr:MAG TPA: Large polyvalent protein-associated domain 3 [Caudoviricetes sp.]